MFCDLASISFYIALIVGYFIYYWWFVKYILHVSCVFVGSLFVVHARHVCQSYKTVTCHRNKGSCLIQNQAIGPSWSALVVCLTGSDSSGVSSDSFHIAFFLRIFHRRYEGWDLIHSACQASAPALSCSPSPCLRGTF